MAVKEVIGGGGHRSRQRLTRYKNQGMTCAELAKESGHEGITAQCIYDRLKRAGFPETINYRNQETILGPMGTRSNGTYCRGQKTLTLLPDGTLHYAKEFIEKYDITPAKIARCKAQGKTSFTREELKEMSRDGRERGRSPMPKKKDEKFNIDSVPYTSSPLERSLMSLR